MRIRILLFLILGCLSSATAAAVTLVPGDILAITAGRTLLSVDPSTGAVETIATSVDIPASSGGTDVVADVSGAVYVSGYHGLARVDPGDGSSAPVMSFASGNLARLQASPDGGLIALNSIGGAQFTDQILRIDPAAGTSQLLRTYRYTRRCISTRCCKWRGIVPLQ